MRHRKKCCPEVVDEPVPFNTSEVVAPPHSARYGPSALQTTHRLLRQLFLQLLSQGEMHVVVQLLIQILNAEVQVLHEGWKIPPQLDKQFDSALLHPLVHPKHALAHCGWQLL